MKRFIFIFILFFSSFSLFSQSAGKIYNYSIRESILFIGGSDSLAAGPSPIVNMLGISLSLPLNQFLYFMPALDVYGTNYGYIDARAVPVEVENRTAFVSSLALDAPLYFVMSPFDKLKFGLGFGILFNPQIALLAFNISESESVNVGAINSYFYGTLRFIYPDVGTFVSYSIADTISISAHTRFVYPWQNLLNNISFTEGMTISAGISIDFKLPKSK